LTAHQEATTIVRFWWRWWLKRIFVELYLRWTLLWYQWSI